MGGTSTARSPRERSMSKSQRVSVQEWLGVEFMPRVCRSVLPKLLLTCFEHPMHYAQTVRARRNAWLPLQAKVTEGHLR